MIETFIDLVTAVMGVGSITESTLNTPSDGEFGSAIINGYTLDGKRFSITMTIAEA
jgi:hypothetical protein